MAVNLIPDDDEFEMLGDLSPGRVIPFSIPASVTAAAISKGNMIVRGVGFEEIGWRQFTSLGEQNSRFTGLGVEILASGPDRNLCGSLSYLDFENSYKGFWNYGYGFDYASKQTSKTTGSHIHGLRVPDGLPEGEEYHVFDIKEKVVFSGSSDESALSLFYVPPKFGFTEPGFGVYNVLSVDDEAGATYFAKWAEDGQSGYGADASKDAFGTYQKSNVVTRDWLAKVAAGWLALSLELKKETTSHSETPGPGIGGVGSNGATLTDSTDGYHAGASVISAWTELDLSPNVEIEGEDGTEDVVLEYGWTSGFQVVVPTETRKNFPILRDTEWSRVTGGLSARRGIDIFNEGEATIEVVDEIEEKNWKDDVGVFAPGEDETLEAVGWGCTTYDGTSSEADVTVESSEIRFLSADGADYKVSAKVHYSERKRVDGEDGSYDREIEHVDKAVTLAEPLVLPALGADKKCWFYQWIEMLSVKRRPAGAVAGTPFVDITETAVIGEAPQPGVHLVRMVRSRSGSMWGFLVLPDGWDDSQRLRRFKTKTLSLESEIKVTETGIESGQSDDVVTNDGGPVDGGGADSGVGSDPPASPQDPPALPPEPPVRTPDVPVLPPERPALPAVPPVTPPDPPAVPPARPVMPPAPPVVQPWVPPVLASNGPPPGGFRDGSI